jgi:hypothetical protein
VKPLLVAWFVVSIPVATARPASAQQPSLRRDAPLLLLHVQSGAPLRLAGGATVVVPFGAVTSSDNLKKQHAVVMRASAGAGGAQIAGGLAILAGPFGPDFLLSTTRTFASPRRADARSTYVGVEAGYVWLIARVSAGVAQRVAGPLGPHRTVFTWSIGLHVPVWR